jgi:predicted Zn-dependent protease
LLWSERRAAQAYHDARLRVAARRYADLVHAAPRNALFWARLGNCEALLKDTQAAAKAYTRALALRPNLMMVRYNLARVRLQEAYAILSNIGRRPKGETDLGARAGFAAWGCGAACGPRARAEHQVRSGA